MCLVISAGVNSRLVCQTDVHPSPRKATLSAPTDTHKQNDMISQEKKDIHQNTLHLVWYDISNVHVHRVLNRYRDSEHSVPKKRCELSSVQRVDCPRFLAVWKAGRWGWITQSFDWPIYLQQKLATDSKQLATGAAAAHAVRIHRKSPIADETNTG